MQHMPQHNIMHMSKSNMHVVLHTYVRFFSSCSSHHSNQSSRASLGGVAHSRLSVPHSFRKAHLDD